MCGHSPMLPKLPFSKGNSRIFAQIVLTLWDLITFSPNNLQFYLCKLSVAPRVHFDYTKQQLR